MLDSRKISPGQTQPSCWTNHNRHSDYSPTLLGEITCTRIQNEYDCHILCNAATKTILRLEVRATNVHVGCHFGGVNGMIVGLPSWPEGPPSCLVAVVYPELGITLWYMPSSLVLDLHGQRHTIDFLCLSAPHTCLLPHHGGSCCPTVS